MGAHSGAKVCRNERFVREPSLATALAYEVIFQKPVSELFAGLYRQIEQEVAARAKTLTYRIPPRKPNQRSIQKCQTLTNIVARQANKSLN